MKDYGNSCQIRNVKGFTLIELLVAISLVAVMATWAVPGFQSFTARNRVAAEMMRIRTALAMARNAAITRHMIITVCPSSNQKSCTINDNAAGDDWLAPLTLFEGKGEVGDVLLRTFGSSLASKLTYRNDNQPVSYNVLGRASGHNGTFRICGPHGEGAKIIVSNFGRVRSIDKGPNDC
ncbi:GspH/FimT family pseudopilin [Halomonas shantousis]